MTNIFLESESMDHQLSNALSTMSLRHLVMFLHFETYAFAYPQKKGFSGKSGVELDFLPHIYTYKYLRNILRKQDMYVLVNCCYE